MIIERYIQQEILQKFAGILALLLLIFISKYYVSYLADAAAGEIAGSAVFQLLALKMLAVIPRLFPVAFFLSVILAFSRLHRDNELVIVSACGQKQSFYLSAVMRLTLVFFVPYAVMVLVSTPWAEHHIRITKEDAKKQSDISGLGAGQFKEFSKGDQVVYMEDMSADRSAMEDVFVQVRQHGKLGVMTSDTASFRWHDEYSERYVVFQDGKRYVGRPGELEYQITDYETYALLMEQSESDPVAQKIDSATTMSLIRMANPQQQAELQKRISNLILFLFLPLLASVLSTLSFEDRQYQHILIVMLIYFLYSNLLGLCETLVAKSKLNPLIGVWWLHLVMIAMLLMLYQFKGIRNYLRGDDNKQQVLSAR